MLHKIISDKARTAAVLLPALSQSKSLRHAHLLIAENLRDWTIAILQYCNIAILEYTYVYVLEYNFKLFACRNHKEHCPGTAQSSHHAGAALSLRRPHGFGDRCSAAD